MQSKPVDKEVLEDDDDYSFMPVKRTKPTIDHKISLYSSMYTGVAKDHDLAIGVETTEFYSIIAIYIVI